MSTYFVFHRTRVWHLPITQPMSPDVIGWSNDYRLVALVEASSFQEAWEKTQHVEKPWQSNPGVTATTPLARSTSVGDVIVQTPIRDGSFQIVANAGFHQFKPVSTEVNAR